MNTERKSLYVFLVEGSSHSQHGLGFLFSLDMIVASENNFNNCFKDPQSHIITDYLTFLQ